MTVRGQSVKILCGDVGDWCEDVGGVKEVGYACSTGVHVADLYDVRGPNLKRSPSGV
jgi:hypothetical protein